MIAGLIKYRKAVIVIWIIFFLMLAPLVSTHYSNYINYGNSNSSSNSESAMVQSILSNQSTQNSTLYVLVLGNPYNLSMEKDVLNFQSRIESLNIKNLSGTESVYTAYEGFMDKTIGKYKNSLLQLYYNFTYYAKFMLNFPSNFYRNYSSNYTISEIANKSGYNHSLYERLFLMNFENTSSNLSLLERINLALERTSFIYFNENQSKFYSFEVIKFVNITQFPNGLINETASFISSVVKFNITPEEILALTIPGDFGQNYVREFGLLGLPTFIKTRFVNSNNTAFLIFITFNVREGYVSTDGFYPAAAATPVIEKYINYYFGNEGYLTGNGAIYYETQQQTAKSGAFFGAIYIVLFIAVLLTLYSYKLSILNLLIVSVTVIIGDLSIIIAAIIAGKVSYVVTYTLTAVLLGITTDYMVFTLYRIRSEMRRGKDRNEILKEPLSNSLKAVLVSGLTVAFSLGMFSFIGSFKTWGITLFMAIVITLAAILLILPPISYYIKPKTFMKGGLKPEREEDVKRSYFYRASDLSVKKPLAVFLVILILALPSMYFFSHYPTTYNFNAGLPQNLESVEGLNKLNTYFGENYLYPVYVLVKVTNESNISERLLHFTQYLFSLNGTNEVIGPYSNGTSVSNSTSWQQYLIDHGNYVFYTIYIKYGPYSNGAINFVDNLRENKSLLVGGLTSSIIDEQNQNNRDFTELAVLISIAIFLVLGLSFRNFKYPIISLSGVFISIIWTLTVLYYIVTYLLKQQIIYLIPVILFVILMSLGNDYSVFIFSRIREEQGKYGNTEGINRGMQVSGKVVTSLGLILAFSLGSLALIPIGFLEQMGLAFLISLVIDTMIIRTLYFPAMISLLRVNYKS